MSTTTTPNMGMILPVPTSEPGPQWATELITALTSILDAHDHSSGKGVAITPSGLNITADLPVGGNNITLLKTLRFSSQSSSIPATSPNLNCLQVVGADLYYNDGNGNQVRITQSGSVTGSSGTITGLPSGTASAAFVAASGTFVLQQSTSTGANLDIGSLIIRYPGSYPAPGGNYIAVQAPSSLSTGYAITLPATLPGSSNSLLTESTAGVLGYTNADGTTISVSGGSISAIASGLVDNATLTSSGNRISVANSGIGTTQIASGAVTTAKIATNAVTQATAAIRSISSTGPGAGGVLITPSCGASSSSITSPTPVNNLNGSITTLGNPVQLIIQPDGTANPSLFQASSSGIMVVQIYRDGSVVCSFEIPTNVQQTSGLSYLDTPAAGNHGYQVYVQAGGGGTVHINYMVLVAYEIK